MSTFLAIMLIFGQAVVCMLLLRVVKNFGTYTERLGTLNAVNVEIHRTNILILEQHQQMLDDIRQLKSGEAA